MAELFEPKNQRLLGALESYLKSREYEALLTIKNTESKRDFARGQEDFAATLLSGIKEEVNNAIKELEELKTKKEKK